MEKRGWIQNKYLIKAYLKEISYESSNRIPNYTFLFLTHYLILRLKKKSIKKINLGGLKKKIKSFD